MRLSYVLVTTSVLLAFNHIFGATSAQDYPKKIHVPNIERIIRPDGWEVPGLTSAKVVTPRSLLKNQKQDASQIYATVLKPEEDVTFESFSYILADDIETLYLGKRILYVRSITQYDVSGHTFCYAVRVAHWVNIDKDTNTRSYGNESGLLYYDDNGDGRFERFTGGGGGPYFLPEIPKWVLTVLPKPFGK